MAATLQTLQLDFFSRNLPSTSLRRIDLSDNAMGQAGMEACAELLQNQVSFHALLHALQAVHIRKSDNIQENAE